MFWNGLPLTAQYGQGPGGWGHMMPFGSWGMILLFIVVVIVVVGLFRATGRQSDHSASSPGPGNQETPLDILKKRYARGEIDKDQFERMKNDL
ncbi:MAG: SHOCT domain-containing protein [Thermodesulfobacteriota bacterium]